MKTITAYLSVVLMLTGAFCVMAQSVPSLINYQGQLLAANGNPLPTGDYEVAISLYPVEAGGAAVWGPQHYNGQSGPGLRPKVSAFEGRFNLILGPEDTTGRQLAEVVADSPALYLEIKVGTGSPIAPRQQLLTAPYALSAANAHDADKLGGYDWSAVFANGNPQTGNMGVGVAPSTMKLDVNGRMRARQGTDGSAGIWFNQNIGGAELDRAFVGMLDNDTVGFYTPLGAGWALTVNGSSGVTAVNELQAWRVRATDSVFVGDATLHTASLLGESYLFFSNVGNYWFDGPIWSTGYNTWSDERLKENVESIQEPLQKLESIRGVTFNFKEDPSRHHADPHRRRVGLLAQDVQEVLPEAVSAAADGYLAVNYEGLVPVLVEAVKAQQRQIQALQQEVNALKAERF
jgi:hypothetical protein